MGERQQIEHYLDQKVNPLLEELLTNIIKNRPKHILNYCRGWLEKKAEHIQMFPDLSDDDEDEDDHRLTELEESKRSAKWYSQRKGICGEVFGSHNLWEDFEVPVAHRKSTVHSRILFRLKSLFLFKDFDDQDINRLIASMTEVSFKSGALIVKEGNNEDDMFIIDTGELEVVKGSQGEEATIKVLAEGEMFGEMSMLYNMPRWASVRARTACVLFKLDRRSYHCLVNERNLRKRKIFQTALGKIEVLKELDMEEKYKLEDLIEEIPIHLNQYIIKEGKNSKKFYIIDSGKFISLKKEKNGHDKMLGEFKEGDVFGESCLYSKQPASSSIMSLTNGKLFAIEKDGLERILGSINKIMKRSTLLYEKYKNYQGPS